MREHFLLPIAILTAFLCGVVYGYGAALLQRRHVSRADTSAAVCQETQEAPTCATTPPPGEEDWIYEIEYRVVTGKG